MAARAHNFTLRQLNEQPFGFVCARRHLRHGQYFTAFGMIEVHRDRGPGSPAVDAWTIFEVVNDLLCLSA